MNAHPVLLQKKYVRVVQKFAGAEKIPLSEALDFFYRSDLYQLVKDGVSDMHCRSDIYLAEDLSSEYHAAQSKPQA